MTTPPPIPPVGYWSIRPSETIVASTIECGDGVNVDLDEDGRIVGIETIGHHDWTRATFAVLRTLRARRSDDPAHSAELANGPTCGFCGKPADVWPSKDCEEPQEHTTAVYDCDCGDVVTIADAIASPKQHRRCHLIGSGE